MGQPTTLAKALQPIFHQIRLEFIRNSSPSPNVEGSVRLGGLGTSLWKERSYILVLPDPSDRTDHSPAHAEYREEKVCSLGI